MVLRRPYALEGAYGGALSLVKCVLLGEAGGGVTAPVADPRLDQLDGPCRPVPDSEPPGQHRLQDPPHAGSAARGPPVRARECVREWGDGG